MQPHRTPPSPATRRRGAPSAITPRHSPSPRPRRARRFQCRVDAYGVRDLHHPVHHGRAVGWSAHLRGPRDRRPPATPTRHRPAGPSRSTPPRRTQHHRQSGRLPNDTTPAFTFTASEEGSTSSAASTPRRSRPAPPRSPCAALSDGQHTFEVRATDPAGNTDADTGGLDLHGRHRSRPTPPSPAVRRQLTNDTTPTFTFTASEAGSTFQCRVDATAFEACTTPFITRRAVGWPAHLRGPSDRRRPVTPTRRRRPRRSRSTLSHPTPRITAGPAAGSTTNHDTADVRASPRPRRARRPVPHRRHGVRRLHRPVHRRPRWPTAAHLRGPRHRRCRQHRPDAGEPDLHGRHRRAGHQHHRQSGQLHQRHHAGVHLHRVRGGLDVPVPRRRHGVRGLHHPVHQRCVGRRGSHLRGPRNRPGR